MSDRDKIKKEIVQQFKSNAFILKKEAVDCIVNSLEEYDKDRRKRWIERIIDGLRKENLSNGVIDLAILKSVHETVNNSNSERIRLVNVFDVTTVPRWEISPDGTKVIAVSPSASLTGHVSLATEALRQRLLLVYQRLRRDRRMAGWKFSAIDSLLADSAGEDVVVLGMLVRLAEDQFVIEDLTGTIPLEMGPSTVFHSGIFAEGSVMLFEGRWDGAVLIASAIGLVPPEGVEETRSVIGNNNWFGGKDRIAFRSCPKLRSLEARNRDSQLVFLSDVHLDKPKTVEAVYSLLSGFSSCPPSAFVFCGDFCSSPMQPDTMVIMEMAFAKLATMMKQYATAFSATDFIFVPGMHDPSLPLVLPRPPLPPSLQAPFSQMSNCTFTTNPARIQFASQEIVVFRNDTVERLCKSAVHVPEKLEDLGDKAARTIVSNGHLCPLPPPYQPVIWPLDSTLRLLPLPDLLVLADRFEAFESKQESCLVANPGPFGRLSFDFHVYCPDTRTMEPSSISMPS